jgi:hypothetical protein
VAWVKSKALVVGGLCWPCFLNGVLGCVEPHNFAGSFFCLMYFNALMFWKRGNDDATGL